MDIIRNDDWKDFVKTNARSLVNFTVEWASAMKRELEKGKKLEDIARATAQPLARKYDINSYMYGHAVTALWRCWPKHGEALRAWNNKDLLGEKAGAEATANGKCLYASLCGKERP